MRIIVLLIGLALAHILHAGDFEQGLAFAKVKHWEKANKSFLKHLHKFPTDSKTLFNMGLCFENQKQYVAALWHFEKAYKYNPRLQETITQIEFCHKKLNNLHQWEAPFSAFQIQIFRLKLNTWIWISINIAIIVGITIFVAMVSKKYRKLAFFYTILGAGIFSLALFCTYQKASAYNENTHGIMLVSLESVFVDQTGNGMMEYSIRAGERVEVVEQKERIGIRFSNDLIAWLEPKQLSLY